jgi:FtsH-binding integral membrane protein
MAEEKQMETTIFDFGLYGAMALAVIAAAAMVIFGLAQVVTSFKSSMKGILGFVALLVVFFVSYSMTDTDISPYIQGAIDKFEQGGAEFTEGNLKFISGGISTTIVLVVVAAAAFVVSEITNLFK